LTLRGEFSCHPEVDNGDCCAKEGQEAEGPELTFADDGNRDGGGDAAKKENT
jgi:hypothetical protein